MIGWTLAVAATFANLQQILRLSTPVLHAISPQSANTVSVNFHHPGDIKCIHPIQHSRWTQAQVFPPLHRSKTTLVNQVIASLLGLIKRVVLQYRIRQERDQLSALPDHLLKDMGISRVDALQESGRSWSDVPEHRKNE